MTKEKFDNQYRIESARAQWHDYNDGVFFITICTQGREHYFGEIIENNGIQEMHPTTIGNLTKNCILKIESLHKDISVLSFVVMPNHVHLLVSIAFSTIVFSEKEKTNIRHKSEIIDEKMQMISLQKGVLSTTIGSFKSAVTKIANQQNIPFGWQTRFHDRIVRDTDELKRITDYIQNNVNRWKDDKFNEINTETK